MARKEITRQEIKRLIRQKGGGGGGGGVSASSNISGDSIVGGNLTLSDYTGVLRADVNGLVLDDTTTTNLPEGNQLYFTDERGQDSVGTILTTNFTYNDSTPSIDLSNTGASAGSYGSATQVPQFTVDAKGRITSVSNVAISIASSINVEDEGTPVISATTLDFKGDYIVAADEGSGVVSITVTDPPVTSVFSRTGAVAAAASDYDADQVDYDNASSGLTATDVQAAIDEANGRIDGLEAAGYILSEIIYYTSNDTFTKASYSGLKAVRVEVLGAGGAGGGAAATGSAACSAGSGGSGGGYSRKFILEGSLSSSETVTVGSGGTGVSGDTGNNGGTSSFGSHVTANGGSAGQVNTRSTDGRGSAGGSGGSATGGDLNIKGGAGEITTLFASSTGQGASGGGGGNYFALSDAKGRATTSSLAGNNSSSIGSGGGGAANGYSQAAQAGGSGGSGIVIVYIYK